MIILVSCQGTTEILEWNMLVSRKYGTFLYGDNKSHVIDILQLMDEEIINHARNECISLDILCVVGGGMVSL